MDSDIIFRYPNVFLDIPKFGYFIPIKKRLKLDTLVPTLFITIFNSKNNLGWIMMAIMLSVFSFQDLEKLYMEVCNFGYFKNHLFWSGFWFGFSNIHGPDQVCLEIFVTVDRCLRSIQSTGFRGGY